MRLTGWLGILGVAAAELGFAKQNENSRKMGNVGDRVMTAIGL